MKSNRRLSKNMAETQKSLTYEYHEALSRIIEDLKMLDDLIPRESCRHSGLVDTEVFGGGAPFIIEARRSAFLRYIQTICRDHVCFADELLKR